MAGIFDRVIGKMFGERGVDKAFAREANVAEQVLEKGQQELDDAMAYVRDINLDTPQLGGDVIDVDVIADPKPLQYGAEKAFLHSLLSVVTRTSLLLIPGRAALTRLHLLVTSMSS